MRGKPARGRWGIWMLHELHSNKLQRTQIWDTENVRDLLKSRRLLTTNVWTETAPNSWIRITLPVCDIQSLNSNESFSDKPAKHIITQTAWTSIYTKQKYTEQFLSCVHKNYCITSQNRDSFHKHIHWFCFISIFFHGFCWVPHKISPKWYFYRQIPFQCSTNKTVTTLRATPSLSLVRTSTSA